MSQNAAEFAVVEPMTGIAAADISAPALASWLGLSSSTSLWTRLRHFVGSPAGAVLGGLLFAAWAALVNRDGGTLVSLRSSSGQFILSTVLTLIDARLMAALFRRCDDRRLGALAAAFGSLAFTYLLVIGVHCLIRTPHILLTILPGIPPTLGYTFMYTLLLLREHAHATAGQ